MQLVSRPTHILKLARPPFKPLFKYSGRGAPGILASRFADFSAALQARYDGKSRDFRRQGLVYRRALLGLFVNRIHRQTHLNLAPRLQLGLQTTPQRVLEVSAKQRFLVPSQSALLSLPGFPTPALNPAAVSIWRRGLTPSLEPDTHPLEIRQAVRDTSRLTAQIPTQMIQRLAARLERVESVRRFTTAAPQNDSQVPSISSRFAHSLPMALPVPQVNLNRMQSIRLEEDQRSDTKTQNATRKQIGGAPSTEWTSYPATDTNIHRLADQVVQVINDRVTARQERFGRI